MNKLVIKLYDLLNTDNELDEDKELYYHAIKLIIHEWSTYVFLIVIACFVNAIIPTILYIVLLTLIRRYSGGYHADTYFMCWFLYTIFYLIFLVLFKMNMFSNVYVSLMVLISSSFYIYKNAPVQHINNPLEVIEKHKYRKFTMLILWSYICTYLILQIINSKISSIVLIVLLFNALLMFFLKQSKSYIGD